MEKRIEHASSRRRHRSYGPSTYKSSCSLSFKKPNDFIAMLKTSLKNTRLSQSRGTHNSQ
jgi:hypothetical protein